MDYKSYDNKTLWSLISDVGQVMSEREKLPEEERTATYNKTTEAWYEIFKEFVCEMDDRRNEGVEEE